jgi:L-amino acid N-acyltransferase YncA
MQPLIIRPATADDSREIWQWRNDPLSRCMSKNTETISLEGHMQWVRAALANPAITMYIGISPQGEKVGICWFNIYADKPTAAISLNLNPEMRGRHLSKSLLSRSVDMFYKKNVQTILALIKKENLYSIACFTKCGFILTEEKGDYFHYTFNKETL